MPTDRAKKPERQVGRQRFTTRPCRWCGGSGEDTAFGGESNTCQSCGGHGVEEIPNAKRS